MTTEVFPNITWEVESAKHWSGDLWQSGGVAMMRHMECALRLAEMEIKAGGDPINRLQVIRDWLARCLYASNMENFKP